MTAPFPKKVTQYLDEVSYADNNSYVPSTFALEMLNLIKLIDGGMTENITPVIHLKMLDSYITQGRNVINLCFRGAAKTSLMRYLIFRIALYGDLPNLGQVPYMLYISDTMENGVKKMRHALENTYKFSPFLQEHLTIKMTEARWELIRKDGRSLIITGYGGKTSIRGTTENNTRPVLALLDDLISDADSRSPTEIENIRTNINSTLYPALHPNRRKIIWNGTPFSASDPLYMAVESGAWVVNVFPVCDKFPCTKEEFQGAWSDRFHFESVNTMYSDLKLQGALASFYQEMMLQILSDDTRLISDSDLKWYSRKALMANKGNFNFYITTDFATSEKQFSDFSFISVWAVNNKGFKYWVDGLCKRQTMDKNIDELFKFCQKYSPQSVGIEVSGQQAGFISWIEKEMLTRNIFFSLASDSNEGRAGIRPSTSKLQRFNVAVPYFKMGEMFFPVEEKGGVALDELLDELSLTTVGGFKSKHDDALDTISMLPLMPIWLPSSSTEFTQGKSKIWGTTVETGSEFTASYFC